MTDDLRQPLDGIAKMLLRDCTEGATNEDGEVVRMSTATKVDVFKAVSAYYLGCNRVNAVAAKTKGNGKNDDDITFESLVQRLGKSHEGGVA